jgi:FkbM family methyltransferase
MQTVRRASVDVGANVGTALIEQSRLFPDHSLFAIEPNPSLLRSLHSTALRIGRPVHVIWGAAWIADGEIDLFMSDRHEASTVIPGKVTLEQYGWPPIDYTKPIRVPCFDFASWLAGLAEGADIVVKMDIEGAEYPVLDRMMGTGAINGVTDLFCEWHYDRYPQMSEADHFRIFEQVGRRTRLHPWR